MNTPSTTATSPFVGLQKADLALKNTVMPTRQIGRLHKDRGDQAILVKWFFNPAEVQRFIPKGIFWAGMVDQARIEEEHASFAQAFDKSWKAVTGRIREGAFDTADSKVESGNEKHGVVSADGLWGALEAHGFKLLRAHAYISRRDNNQKGVIELRFVHNSVFEISHVALAGALGGLKGKGLCPGGDLISELNKMMYFKMGFCTVFSNTATFDPTITINFRAKFNDKGERRVFFLRDGTYGFDS